MKGFKPGMRVVALNSAPCQACFYCSKHQENLCEDLLFNNGAYAEYIRVPKRIVDTNMLAVPSDVSYEEAAMVEPLACVLRGLHETGVEIGDTVTETARPTTEPFPGFKELKPMVFAGLSADDAREKAAGLLKQVGLGERLKHKPPQLSGGQHQRVACARASTTGARLRASFSRHPSISARKASSTSCVPRLPFTPPANWSVSGAISKSMAPMASSHAGLPANADVSLRYFTEVGNRVTPSGFSDPDGDTLAYSYAWTKNGSPVGSNSKTLDLSTAGNGDKGDVIAVSVTAVASGQLGPFHWHSWP